MSTIHNDFHSENINQTIIIPYIRTCISALLYYYVYMTGQVFNTSLLLEQSLIAKYFSYIKVFA